MYVIVPTCVVCYIDMPRNRGHNYTEREKQELTNIVCKYKDIIENKKKWGVATTRLSYTYESVTSGPNFEIWFIQKIFQIQL